MLASDGLADSRWAFGELKGSSLPPAGGAVAGGWGLQEAEVRRQGQAQAWVQPLLTVRPALSLADRPGVPGSW